METIKDAFCKNFTRLVESSDLTQKAIVQKMKVTEPTFYRWKSGDSEPDFKSIELLAKILNVDPYDFYRPISDRPVVKVLKIKDVLKNLDAIPEEVYDMAPSFDPGDEVWSIVKAVMKKELELKLKKQQKKNHA